MDQLVKILDDIESSKWPTAEYEVMLTGVTVNNTKFSQLSLFVSYDAGGSLRLSCADEAAIKNALEHDGDLKLTASNLQGTAKLWSRFVPSDYYDGFSLDLVAEAGSVSLLNGTTLDRIEATVVNGPLLFKKNIIDFEAGEFNLSYRQFKNITNEKMSKAGRVKTNIATGRVVLSRVDGGEICLNEANEKLEEFRRFLTMVRGRYCGLGNSFFYSGTNMVGAKLGFTKVDSLVLLEGWYDWDLDHQLSDIFIRYSSATAEEAKSEVLYL
ncbi:MAG: hypothetical protein ABF245_01850, partial [Planktotalea arctica]